MRTQRPYKEFAMFKTIINKLSRKQPISEPEDLTHLTPEEKHERLSRELPYIKSSFAEIGRKTDYTRSWVQRLIKNGFSSKDLRVEKAINQVTGKRYFNV